MQTKTPPINYGRQTKRVSFKVEAKGITTNAKGQEVGEIEAFGAIYGNVDDGNDRVNVGASKRTILNSKQRAKNRQKDYILPMIWNHDTDHFLPIGGWYDVDGDHPEGLLGKAHVLLSTQTGREYYELAKAGMVDTFSVIYDIPKGGAYYDSKTGVREITEWRIHSMDPVIFAMNDETYTVAVKSSEGKQMDEKDKLPKQKKTLLDHYNDEMAEDLLEDWQDVYVCALTGAIFDAFTIGDQPQSDIAQALDDFKELIMSKFVTQAVECNLSQYLSDNGFSYTPGLSQMLNGSDDGYYGYMSRRSGLSSKAGKPISATNQGHIDDHVAGLHDTADKGIKALKTAMQHMKAIHGQADDFADTMSSKNPDDNKQDDGKQPENGQDGKSMESALTLIKGLRTNNV